MSSWRGGSAARCSACMAAWLGDALKAGDGGLHLGRIGPESLSQRGQESQARLGFGRRIALQQQARQRHAGSLAAAGEELLAQGDQIFRRRRAAGAAQQAAAALAQGLQQLVQEGIGHGESDRGVVG